MLKKFFKHKNNSRFLAWLLVGIMTLSCAGVLPVSAQTGNDSASTPAVVSGGDGDVSGGNGNVSGGNGAPESGGNSGNGGATNVYVLESSALEAAAGGTYTDGQAVEGGTDDYFTMYMSTSTKIDSSSKSWTGDYAYSSSQRLSLGGKASLSTPKNAIMFTTSDAATVKIWWAQGGDDNREFGIWAEDKTTLVTQTSGTYTKNTAYYSELELEEAGTYYLGGITNNNYIFKIEVEEVVSAPSSTTNEYVLESSALAPAAGGAYTDGQAVTGGTDDFFTMYMSKSTKIDSSSKSWTGDYAYSSGQRLSLGGKASLSIPKNAIMFTTEGTATVKIWWAQGGDDNREFGIWAEDKTTLVTQTSGTYTKNTAYYSELELANPGTYYLGGITNNNYIFKIVVVDVVGTSAKPTVSTVTATQDASDEAKVTVSFTGKAGLETAKYTVEASKDGEEWIKVGTVKGNETSGSVEVDLTGEDFGYGEWQFRVVGNNTVVAAETISFLADTYTLTGTYNTGLGDDVALLTDIKFNATSDSIYVVPDTELDTTNHTYSVVLEKGTTYEVEAIGVNEYMLAKPAEAFTYSADTTLNLEFKEKVFYPISISLGATPDLTGKNVTYTFTHEDGAVYEFNNANNIALRDGKYKVSLGGDIAQVAYGMKTGNTLEVNGAAVNHAITFQALTSWSFLADYTTGYEGNTGWYQGLYLDATSGKIAPNGTPANSAQFNTGAVISVPVSGPCSISVTAYQADMALYKINGEQASTTSVTTTVEYTGEAGTVDIVSTGGAYIVSITLTYPIKEVEFVAQSVMPFVPEDDVDASDAADTDGNPRQNVKESMTVQPVGQKLNLSQTGGVFGELFIAKKADEESKVVKDVAYYLFPKAKAGNTLEFDLLVTEAKATSNYAGFFGGVFTDNYVYSLGLRGGGQKVRGIYSKNGGIEGGNFAGAGSPSEENIGLNRSVHYVINWNGARPVVTISFYDDAGVLQERQWSQNPLAEPDGSTPTEFYYGFALANCSATITNMLYKDADGKVLYDQNACYYPNGAAPTASDVSAVAAEDRTHINVTWKGSVPENDGTYVVEMQKDGGEWVELTDDVTGFSYRYDVPAGDGGNYKFRVAGQLGKKSLGGDRTAYATMTETVFVLGALETPVIAITAPQVAENATKGTITLDWQDVASAEYYQVYRYSADQGENAAVLVAEELTVSEYVDNTAVVDMPYYYYVKAVCEAQDNESPFSATVWNVVTTKRDGNYTIYGAETEDLFLTKKSYDTVFTNKATVEGVAYASGTLKVVLNGAEVSSEAVVEGDTFAYELTLVEGRNDVELILAKEDETTRRALNFVYLTKYDIVVDAAFTGTDGATDANGIPTYKTVQAAVDSVPSNNADNVVILVLAGSYEERLEVKSPYISLIGEDRENTLIHYYPGNHGDMAKRCATYIYDTAKNFTAENISFANDFVYTGGNSDQADAIRVDADNATFVNVHLIGVQDTLYMGKGYQYYEKCLIEGLVDFIYSGEMAKAVFYDCELRFVYEPSKTSGYVSAPKTAATGDYGLVFINCAITAEEGCAGTGYLLARPWGATAQISWINTYMGKVINAYAPYNDMSGNMHENARFYEYGTFGPGFQVNVDRRQLSENQANAFSAGKDKGVTNKNEISSAHYVGDIVTDREASFVEQEAADDKYFGSASDDTGLAIYNQEGYASYYEVTGGGLLKETNANYYKVGTAEDFLDALLAIKASAKNSVIELTADINLGCNEVENFDSYSSSKLLTAYSAQALTHPTLIESGVSKLNLEGIHNLTIFSQNGASIKHANITIKKSSNIIIRNIKFDELWEWDEATEGDYDRNDWDYMTLDDTCNGIWIDHCTFYKAYDGIIDIKNPNPENYVTISWCEFLPGSENDTFFDVMMDEIYANPSEYPTYQAMQNAGMTEYQIYMYAYGQKKTHLLGQDDTAKNAAGIRVTLANNYYYNSMDRMPRLRYGNAHVYNCIMDSQELLNVRLSIKDSKYASKIVSNGAASTCGAQVLLENCYISGIQNAMNSGNGSSPSGYINDKNSVYYMNGELTELEPKVNTSKEGEPLLVLDADAFIASLPYADYTVYNADDLYSVVVPRVGAGKVNMTVQQWLTTNYNVSEEEEEAPEDTVEIIVTESEVVEGIPAEKAEEILEAIGDILGVETVEELETLLVAEVTEADGATDILPGLSKEDTSVVEVTIKISKDGGQTWTEITSNNANEFPAEGVEVVIPYPAGTNAAGYDFVIGHLVVLGCNGRTPGDMEFYNPTETANGLKIRIYSASPFVIGYKEVHKASSSSGSSAPSIPSTIDWENVNAEVIAQAAAIKANPALGILNVNAVSSGNIVVPAFVLESLKGSNVSLMLHNGQGVAMSIYGAYMSGPVAQAVNVTVVSNVNTIPASVVASKAANALMTKQISVKNAGVMPVAVSMHVNVGSEFAGKYASLYRYNAVSGQLELAGCFLVTASGQAMYGIGQGGEYLLVVTNEKPAGTIMNAANRYIVKSGDSMYAIARMYNMTFQSLRMKNPQIKDANLIYVGDSIYLY